MTNAAFLATWTLTMAGMMLPSTTPLLQLEYAASRSRARVCALAAGYFCVWLVVGVAVVAGDAAVGMHGHRTTAALLAVAALYQLLPVKRRCLARCRAPLTRMLLAWRDGLRGAARMGVTNGIWCAGCCAGLMVALLGLGLMSWAWMAAVGAVVVVEKATPVGAAVSRPLSAGLAAAAVVWAV
jgi:predicted metal-binding membrane protein